MTKPTPAPELERPKRMTLSQIVELLLARGATDRSTVSIARNAKGETQFEVTVRTGEDGEVVTVEDAERKALEVYGRLHEQYPMTNGHENADVELTRNAKGETQISVGIKTAEGTVATLEEAAAKAHEVYDQTRRRYPMADGNTAKPGSVA
jgi:hypothetical protein